MLKTTSCFKENDILVNDRGFLSRKMLDHLKTERKVDTYIPARENMTIFEDAVTERTARQIINTYELRPENTCRSM